MSKQTRVTLRRRGFIGTAIGGGMGLALPKLAAGGPIRHTSEELGLPQPSFGNEEEVSPAEDLMREHGVLKRVLLIYREGIRRMEANADLPPEAIFDSAKLIREFIEDYHEKLEEDFLFPRFRSANVETDLVAVLSEQHQAGRRVTDVVMRLANAAALKRAEDRRKLIDALSGFVRMYEPHEAREDTVLFPALRKIVTANEYDSLGEEFEEKEHQLFGEDGFEAVVDRVATLEKSLGIFDLSQFTPAE